MRRAFGGAVLAVLALLVAGPAGAATRVGGFAATTKPDVKLGPLRLGIPRPAPGTVFGAFKIRATSKAALASASKPYEIRLAPSSAHGDVLVTAVHTDPTKTAVTRTVLFLVANAPTRALSATSSTGTRTPKRSSISSPVTVSPTSTTTRSSSGRAKPSSYRGTRITASRTRPARRS